MVIAWDKVETSTATQLMEKRTTFSFSIDILNMNVLWQVLQLKASYDISCK
jgi:hypothetical protein